MTSELTNNLLSDSYIYIKPILVARLTELISCPIRFNR